MYSITFSLTSPTAIVISRAFFPAISRAFFPAITSQLLPHLLNVSASCVPVSQATLVTQKFGLNPHHHYTQRRPSPPPPPPNPPTQLDVSTYMLTLP
jgi:hypothetical protein